MVVIVFDTARAASLSYRRGRRCSSGTPTQVERPLGAGKRDDAMETVTQARRRRSHRTRRPAMTVLWRRPRLPAHVLQRRLT